MPASLIAMLSIVLVSLLWVQSPTTTISDERARVDDQNAVLRTLLERTPGLPFQPTTLNVTPPPTANGWALGMVSWLATDRDGLIYLLQRGDQADPVIVIDGNGHIVRSWGRGMYTTPHAIRIDPHGDVWTTDAASSVVYKFSPQGVMRLRIDVGGQPAPCGRFCGTTDVAFASNGHVYVTDGYRNARVIEYTAEGERVREWGTAGTGSGQFRLPHSIAIDENGIVYVADRENGRVQRFDLHGTYLGEWAQYGKTYALALDRDAIWLSNGPRGSSVDWGWLMKLDRASGRLLGHVDVGLNHGLALLPSGEPLSSPGTGNIPQRFRRSP